MVREERVLAAVDRWLGARMGRYHLDSTVAAILAADKKADAEPPEVTQARHREQRLGVELERVLAAIRAGMDPVLAAGQTRKIQADLMAARSVIERWGHSHEPPPPLGEPGVRAVLTEARGLVKLLEEQPRHPHRTGRPLPGARPQPAGAGFEPASFGL